MCVLSFMHKQAFPTAKPENFHEWVANQFGERLFSIFFKTYTEKVWGMSCDEISADWAAQRIKGLDLWTAMSNALRNSLLPARRRPPRRAAQVIKTLIDSFQYPRKGPGMMWDAAAAQDARAAAATSTWARGSRACAGTRATRCWTIAAQTQDGESKTFTARHVISSAPIRELVAGIASGCQHARPAADSLRYRDFITVALIVEKPDLFPDNWIYIHEPASRSAASRTSAPGRPRWCPIRNLACLGLEYFCFEGDGLWNATDGELIALAKKELGHHRPRRPKTRSRTAASCARRRPIRSTTRATRTTSRRSAPSWRETFPTLHLVGRNGMHKYNNQDHAMMTAMLTVKNIVAGGTVYDVWNVNEDAEYHEAGAAGEREALSSAAPGARPRRRALNAAMHGDVDIAHARPSATCCLACEGSVPASTARLAAISAAAVTLHAGERVRPCARLRRLYRVDRRGVWPPLAGVLGYAAGTVLHYGAFGAFRL